MCIRDSFYIVAVYFGAVGIKNTRYAIPCGLIADAAGIVAAIDVYKRQLLCLYGIRGGIGKREGFGDDTPSAFL